MTLFKALARLRDRFSDQLGSQVHPQSLEVSEVELDTPAVRAHRTVALSDKKFDDSLNKESSTLRIDDRRAAMAVPGWTPRHVAEQLTPLAAYSASVTSYAQAMREYVDAPRTDPIGYYTTLDPYRKKVEACGRLMGRASSLLVGDRLRLQACKNFAAKSYTSGGNSITARSHSIAERLRLLTRPPYDSPPPYEPAAGLPDLHKDGYLNAVSCWSDQESHLHLCWSRIKQVWEPEMLEVNGGQLQKHYSWLLRDDELDVDALRREMKHVKRYIQDVEGALKQYLQDVEDANRSE